MPSLCTSMSDPTRKLTSFSLAGKVTSLVLYFWVHMNLSYKHMYIFIFSSNAHVHHIYFHACLACFLLSGIICRNMMDVFCPSTFHHSTATQKQPESNWYHFFLFLPPTVQIRIKERKESVTILLCGTSGCGKSTLSSLLVCLSPRAVVHFFGLAIIEPYQQSSNLLQVCSF